MRNIYYWSPFTSKVATIKSVINSAYAIKRYSSKKYCSYILNAVGEWDDYLKEINEKKINVINLNKNTIFKDLDKEGFLRSRIAYLYIFFKCIFSLNLILKNKKPDFLIIHLITSLPLFLFIFQNFKTKLILRISGLPKMNFFRKMLWKLAIKKIYKISCPTLDTYKDLSKINFLKEKLIVLNDPIINVSEIKKIFKTKFNATNESAKKVIKNREFFLSIGRFTKQKNFIFYLKCIPKILRFNKNLLFVFIGTGDEDKLFFDTAKNLNILDNLIIIKNTDNVHYFMKKTKCFVLTSLWEDPGFVLVEAGYNNCQVISSDCPNGPKEIIGNDGGYLFRSNNEKNFLETFYKFLNDTKENKLQKKINLKKRVKNYTIFEHARSLKKILEVI